MPLPTTSQPTEARPNRLVHLLPKTEEKKDFATHLLEFLQQELKHWRADLEDRKKEGEYYLELLAWREPDSSNAKPDQTFLCLVCEEIPALVKLIKDSFIQQDDPNMDKLLSIQRTYFRFCERFDRIKLELVKGMNWEAGLKIY